MKRFAGLVVFILAVSVFTPTLSSAAIVWSDDFQDGDYVGWTVLNGTFSADDNVLRATGSDEYRCIHHSSPVVYGNWTFDVYRNSSVGFHHTLAFFIMADELVEGPLGEMVPRNGYSLGFAVFGASFNLWTDGTAISLGGFSTTFTGWRTITITRDNSGHFELYFNETLEEEIEDTTHTTSAIFVWSTRSGHAIDNVIIIEPEPSTLAIDPLLLGIGVAIVVVVIVIVVYVRRR